MHGSLKFHLQLKTKEDMEVGAWEFKGKNGSLVSEHLLGQADAVGHSVDSAPGPVPGPHVAVFLADN